jgi:predicted alpha/beta-hydrolase family hydrolase
MAKSLLYNGPADAPLTLALAHGAGAPMDHAFMETMAAGIGDAGFRVARFEFPYMAKRREDGKKRPPDREPALRATLEQVAQTLGADRLVIGGKSMGGRIASMMADELGVRGLVCLGYPFHAPGKPERVRADHLKAIKTPTLIVQGERDPFGTRDDIAGYALGRKVELRFLGDGEHSFKPRKKSGRCEEQNLAEAVDVVSAFMKKIASK